MTATEVAVAAIVTAKNAARATRAVRHVVAGRGATDAFAVAWVSRSHAAISWAREARVMLHPRARCGSGPGNRRDASRHTVRRARVAEPARRESITESPERSRPARCAAGRARGAKVHRSGCCACPARLTPGKQVAGTSRPRCRSQRAVHHDPRAVSSERRMHAAGQAPRTPTRIKGNTGRRSSTCAWPLAMQGRCGIGGRASGSPAASGHAAPPCDATVTGLPAQ